MKKICTMLMVCLLLLGLAACGATKLADTQEGFTIIYNGCEIKLNSDAEPIIASLGEPKGYTEEASCAFDGLDKTYFYGSFYLSTYPRNGKDFVYSVWFVDDGVATEEGIRIGNPQTEVEKIWGTDCFRSSNTYTQVKNDSKMTIILTNGIVSSIQYEAIVE